MNQAPTEAPDKPKDRRLGDEWTDWKGDGNEGDLDEKLSTFLSLSAAVLFACVSFFVLTWFMIKPRFEQLHPSVADFAGWAVTATVAGFLIVLFFEGAMLVKRGKSLLPYKWTEKFFLSLLPRTIWLGGKFGISKDRIGNSFIKMHNVITRSHVGRISGRKLLILLPRCLKKEARAELTSRLSGNNFKVVTAAGGEEAREAIRQYRPTTILAIACERDLMSGLKDVAEKIPVIAIPNKRPEGPCKNTHFSVPELEEALKFLMPAKRQ